jgi:dTDP-4-dehydrorhamnose 3,5-epimerase
MSAPTATASDLPFLLVSKRHEDNRGWFSETFRESKLGDLGINCRFIQENQSYSRRAGTLRGLHLQVPPRAQAKMISVLRGRILDVAVDVRKNSPTYGKYLSVELSAAEGQQFYVPVGFAHGFLTLEDDTIVMYKVSDYYSPAHERGFAWNDPAISFPWPVAPAGVIVSDKDAALPSLTAFDSPFAYDGHRLEGLAAPKMF